MFDKVGRKISGFAMILYWLSIVGIFLAAIYFGGNERYFELLLVLVIGIPLSYLNCIFLVAFGELVENTRTNAVYMKKVVDILNKSTIIQNDSEHKEDKESEVDIERIEKMLIFSLRYSTDEGCRDYIKDYRKNLSKAENERICQLDYYMGKDDPVGIRDAVENILHRL